MSVPLKIVPQGKGFYVHDAQGNPVNDAEVTVNGKAIAFDPVFYQYRLAEDTPAPFDLRIQHPVHGELQLPSFFFDTDRIYFQDPDGSVIWTQGVQVPVRQVTDAYYLLLSNSGAEADPQARNTEVEGWTAAWKGAVQRIPLDRSGDITYRKLSLGKPLRNAEDGQALQSRLEAEQGVQFFGPLLFHMTRGGAPAGLSAEVEIQFLPETSAESIQALVDEAGLADVRPTTVAEGPVITARLTRESGWDLVPAVARLNSHPQVRYANNVLMIQVTHQ